MRAFIAIDLPDEHKDGLASLQTRIANAAWVRPAGYHLTLRFLGDHVPEEALPRLSAALRTVEVSSFEIALTGVGRFPAGDRQAARVIWVGLQPTSALTALHAKVQSAIAEVGYAPENHAYSPHITLARIRARQRQSEVAKFLQMHAGFRIDPFVVNDFHLMQSILTPHGALYNRLDTFALR